MSRRTTVSAGAIPDCTQASRSGFGFAAKYRFHPQTLNQPELTGAYRPKAAMRACGSIARILGSTVAAIRVAVCLPG